MPDTTPLRSNYDAEFADAIYARWNAEWWSVYGDDADALAYARAKADAYAGAGDPEAVAGSKLKGDTVIRLSDTVLTAFTDECEHRRESRRRDLIERAAEDERLEKKRKRREQKEWRERTGHTHNERNFHDTCPACLRERATAEAERVARENARLRKRQLLVGWAVGSWVVATVIFCLWTAPLDVAHAGEDGFRFINLFNAVWVGGIAYLILFGVVFRSDDEPSTRKLLAISAVIPVACVIGGFALASKHEQFDRGFKSFAAYTGHFPRNALGEPYISSDYSSVVTTCAKQIRTSDTHFCVETITQPKFPHRGDYVIDGSFRFRERDQDSSAPPGLILAPFDCSGDTTACPRS